MRSAIIHIIDTIHTMIVAAFVHGNYGQHLRLSDPDEYGRNMLPNLLHVGKRLFLLFLASTRMPDDIIKCDVV